MTKPKEKEESYGVRTKRRQEERAKVLMVIEAAKEPLTNKELLENPTLQGITAHSLNHYLRGLDGIQYKYKKWSLKKKNNGSSNGNGHQKKTKRAKHDTPELPHAHFLIKSNGDLYLSIGTTSLPVGFE